MQFQLRMETNSVITSPSGMMEIRPALGDAQHGFPYPSGAGRLVIKDVLLLAGGLLVMADSARALLATWPSAAPLRGRVEWSGASNRHSKRKHRSDEPHGTQLLHAVQFNNGDAI